MPMKTIEGYSKEKYTNTSVLLAGGGAKALSDFIGSLSWDSTNKKIKYTPVGGSATDLVTLSWDNIANKPTSLPANGGNADTVDGYHISDNYNLLYKNVTNLTCTPSSITTDYWYVKILIQSSYQTIVNQKMYLIASYSNFMTKAELQVYGFYLGYKYTASRYNADTITGIASTRQDASQVIWLRMKKPTQYEGVTPNGNISIYSNYIASAEVITSAPSGVIFTDTLQSDGQHILSGNIKAASFEKNGSSNSYVLLGGGGHKAISEFKIGDYLPLSGGTMSNTNVVTNLNADLLDGKHASAFATSSHTHPYLSFSSIWPTNITNLNDYFSFDKMYSIRYDYARSSNIQNGPYESDAGAVINFPTYSGTQVYFNYYNNDVKVRTHYNGHITNWATFITSENIGSQHVSYADSAGSVAWGNVTGKPSTFTPSSHSHAAVDYLYPHYNSGDKPNPQEYFNENIGVKVAMTRYANIGGSTAWHDTLWINGYTGSDVPYVTSLTFRRDGTPRFFVHSQSNRSTSYGTYYEVITAYNIGSQHVNYADSAGSVAWTNITGKPFNWSGQSGQPSWLWGSNDGTNYYVWNPSNFNVNYANSAGSASSSTYARYLTCPDTRSSAPAPGDYTATSTGVSFDFKESSVTGLSGYSGVMTVRPYASGQDWSGGEAHQIAFLAGGGLYHRIGTSSWGSWERILTSSNWSSYISIPTVGNGTVTVTQDGSTIGSFTMNQSGNTLIALNDTNTNYYPIRSYTTGLQISSYSGSADCALFVPYATNAVAGVVSTAVQSFAGQKTFLNGIKVGSISGDQSTDNAKIYFGDGKYVWIGESPQDDALMLNCGTGKNIYFSFAGSTTVTSSNYSTYAKIYMSNSGAVYASSGFYESSDERLKKVVDTIKVNLDDLAKLRKIYYLWNNTPEDGRQLGMIAQDVQKLYPELVSMDKNTGYLSLAYDKLSVIALEAIDTLYEEYKQLKERVNKLEKLLHSKEIL